jgi:hypothetical protein
LFRARTVSLYLHTAHGGVLDVAWIVAQYELCLEVVRLEIHPPTYTGCGIGRN